MYVRKKKINIQDYLPKRNLDSNLWEKVQQLSEKEDRKIEAINIIFEQQYKLPKENMELIKKLAKKEQPRNVRLHVAKSLEQNGHIPYGMYTDLMEILSKEPDPEIQKHLKNIPLYKLQETFQKTVQETFQIAFEKIQPYTLTNSLKLLLEKREELTKILQPFSKMQNFELGKQITEMQKRLSKLNLEEIKIPKFSFDIDNASLNEWEKSKPVGSSVDSILTKFAESNPEIKEAMESKKKIDNANKPLDAVSDQWKSVLKTIERSFKDVGNKQNEHHTEQMAEHQKTRDEVLIDNGKLQEKIETLQNKVSEGWRNPKNWSVGFIISILASLSIWIIQNYS